jgi:uncharacterized repeat protein (TIGR03803 family)
MKNLISLRRVLHPAGARHAITLGRQAKMQTLDKPAAANIPRKKEGFMASTIGHWGWISRVAREALSGALALAIILVLTMVAAPSAQAQTYSVLYTFHDVPDGAYPSAGLVRDTAGNLYGTTAGGGSYTDCYIGYSSGCGTVFKLDTASTETVLYSFTGGADGRYPMAGLIRSPAGTLYGTTEYGGASNGYGVVFKLDTNGKETVLYTFTSGPDGINPVAGLVPDTAGNLYGTTSGGGSEASSCGTVFKLDASTGKKTILHTFNGGADGRVPLAGLIRDTAGNLYGTTSEAGAYGAGVVFELDTTGTETVLHTFQGRAGGGGPSAGLLRGPAGNLYGTTAVGGDRTCNGGAGCGVVFKLETTGFERVLHTFTRGPDGGIPLAGLIRDAAGNLYGTTSSGGDLTCSGGGGCGVVFRITP